MHSSTLFPQRIVRALAVLFTFGAASGCADPSGPAPSVSPNAIIIDYFGGHPMVFNAQLRFIGNPDVKPLRAVVGHLQLKIHDSGETGLVINWKAHILNPECESSTSFGGGIYSIQDSEDLPSPEDLALIDLRSPERVLGCGDSLVEGAIGISAELAARLVTDPEDFVAVFFLDDGGVIAGTLQLGGPDT
jgi:hypothetical protein